MIHTVYPSIFGVVYFEEFVLSSELKCITGKSVFKTQRSAPLAR